jgi:hypothetical protein
MEQLEPAQLRASVLEVNEERFYARSIRQLYSDRRYPLLRQPRDEAQVHFAKQALLTEASSRIYSRHPYLPLVAQDLE